MRPLKTLLAATDFSVSARRAEERAALLARAHGARLILLHCLPGLEFTRLRAWHPGSAETKLREAAQTALQARADDLAARFGIVVAAQLTEGQAHREIENAAAETRADIVVVGAAGAHPLREFFLGSTAERVVRACSAPVLVVRDEARAPYERVLAAIDLSPISDAVLQSARRIAPGAYLTLAHAFEIPFEEKLQYAGVSETEINHYKIEERNRALAALHALSGNVPDAPAIRIEHGMPDAVLIRLLQETGVELAVAGKHGASEVADLLLGSVSKHLLREAGCDVLVIPEASAPH